MLESLSEKKYIVVSLSTTIVVLLACFITVLIILLVKNTTPVKNNSEPLILNKIIYAPESMFTTEEFELKEDVCQNSASAYEYYLPEPTKTVMNCVMLYAKKSEWLYKFLVKNMGLYCSCPDSCRNN